MAKYLDLKVGKKLKLFRLTTGIKQDGNRWGLFSFTPFEKTDKGDYIYGQEYTIFINNLTNEMNLKDGDFVEIANIISVSAEDKSFKTKDGVQHNKRVINVTVDIKANENQVNNNQSNNYQPNNYNEETGEISGSSYDLPDF